MNEAPRDVMIHDQDRTSGLAVLIFRRISPKNLQEDCSSGPPFSKLASRRGPHSIGTIQANSPTHDNQRATPERWELLPCTEAMDE